MAAIGACWASGSWEDDSWADGSWAALGTVAVRLPPFSAHGSWGTVTAEGVSGKTSADGTWGVTAALE